jgi:uncharacterized membrane protein YjgN (DUF898 family)
MNWYYAVNGQQFGPIDAAEFSRKVAEGIITANTLVWREGMVDWRPWREVAGDVGNGLPAGVPPPPPLGSGLPVAGVDGTPLQLKFTGTWEGYFRVWIVNVLLTLVTFGIYAAWAKVRKKRYFYAHTTLAGHAFEYLADPKKILIGNIIVAVVFVLYSASGAISPLVQVPMMLAVAVLVPWFIVRAFLFNARNSAWRGLRFGFHGKYWGAVRTHLLLPLLVPLTLGLMLPYVSKERRKWVVGNHRFGTAPFGFGGTTGGLARIYLKAALFFLPIVGAYVYFIAQFAIAAASRETADAPEMAARMAMVPVLFIVGFPLAFLGTIFLRARLFTYYWSTTTVGPHAFRAYMRARDLLGLQLLNSLVVSATFGLLWPWAAVRTVKFQLDSIDVVPAGSLDTFVAEAQPPVSAIGEAAGDFLDFDLGFGV